MSKMLIGVTAGLAVALLTSAAASADGEASAKKAGANAPPRDALRGYLLAPKFQFSRIKEGADRRDPFEIPLQKVTITKDSSGRPVDAKRYGQIVASETERLKKLAADLEVLKAAIVADDRDRILSLYHHLQDAFKPGFVLVVNKAERDRLRQRFDGLKPRISTILVEATLASAQEKARQAKAAFAEGKFAETVTFAGEFDKLGQFPEAEQSPVWRSLSAEVVALARRANAHLEFEKKSIRVSSLLVTKNGGAAVINRVPCHDGSKLDANTLVAKVTATGIVFVYKGERIEYRFGLR